ncbi:MAG TPA: DUF6763 family protein [Gammaproteobacteria bacterium]|jgi:hypothetical protein|nr:DUF6763 family protein [Gammaproteobacteria bacterium]
MDSDPEFPPVAAGDWYQTMSGELFEVIAVDENEDTIEVQFFDGTVAEFDRDSWNETVLGPAAAPEDWSGSLDISREDFDSDGDIPLDRGARPRGYLDLPED